MATSALRGYMTAREARIMSIVLQRALAGALLGSTLTLGVCIFAAQAQPNFPNRTIRIV